MLLSCRHNVFFLHDIPEDPRAIKWTKLHLSGRDTFGLQLGEPISFGVLFYSQWTSFCGITLTLRTIVVKAVTHKHDLPANTSLGRTALPPPTPPPHPCLTLIVPCLSNAFKSCSHHCCLRINSPNVLHHKLLYWYWTTRSKC